MRWLIAASMLIVAVAAVADERKPTPPAKGTTIYQTDKYGNVQYNKQSWVVKDDGRLIEVSPYGREQSHEQQYVTKKNRVYHADSTGRIQHNKPSYTVGADGRVIPNDPYGNPQYQRPQYVIKDSTVYRADAAGRATEPAYKIDK